jgi:hypothetical protein
VGGLVELLPERFAVPYGAEDELAHRLVSLIRHPDQWPASEVSLRASAWCEPRNAADKVLSLASRP